ncbi:BolA family transcriptional regulator [soil metagenome]
MAVPAAIIESTLRSALDIESIEVEDESWKHAGHAGAASGGGHYRLRIVSVAFEGLSRVSRHRLVYDRLHSLMANDIHALAIDARTPSEVRSAA